MARRLVFLVLVATACLLPQVGAQGPDPLMPAFEMDATLTLPNERGLLAPETESALVHIVASVGCSIHDMGVERTTVTFKASGPDFATVTLAQESVARTFSPADCRDPSYRASFQNNATVSFSRRAPALEPQTIRVEAQVEKPESPAAPNQFGPFEGQVEITADYLPSINLVPETTMVRTETRTSVTIPVTVVNFSNYGTRVAFEVMGMEGDSATDDDDFQGRDTLQSYLASKANEGEDAVNTQKVYFRFFTPREAGTYTLGLVATAQADAEGPGLATQTVAVDLTFIVGKGSGIFGGPMPAPGLVLMGLAVAVGTILLRSRRR